VDTPVAPDRLCVDGGRRRLLERSRNCASACDAFSGAVRDLGAGKIVGTRTAGFVSGPASGYLLNDGSQLILAARHELSAAGEIINGIGVAPDHHIPLTADDLSAGRDPGLDKARALLAG
jgi:carboxyl-terminal processing protease